MPLRSLATLSLVLAICLGRSSAAEVVREASTAAPAAPCCTSLPRPQDQVWLVSDRGLGCGEVNAQATNLQYWHYQGGTWQASNSAAFLASDDPQATTAIWIHGNQIDHGRAFQVGWTVYSAIARQATDPKPLRFVVWSWPSERTDSGLFEDVRIKAARTGPSALHLARFIDAMSSDVPVSLMGYSFRAGSRAARCNCSAAGRSTDAD